MSSLLENLTPDPELVEQGTQLMQLFLIWLSIAFVSEGGRRLSLLYIRRTIRRRRHRTSLSNSPLPFGESLVNKATGLEDDSVEQAVRGGGRVVILASFMVMCVWAAFLSPTFSWLYATIVSAVLAVMAWWSLSRAKVSMGRLLNLRQNYTEQMLVAEQLDTFRFEGYSVFHDLRLGDKGQNLDHLMLGPEGVIGIKTMMLEVRDEQKPEMRYDGEKLLFSVPEVVEQSTEWDSWAGRGSWARWTHLLPRFVSATLFKRNSLKLSRARPVRRAKRLKALLQQELAKAVPAWSEPEAMPPIRIILVYPEWEVISESALAEHAPQVAGLHQLRSCIAGLGKQPVRHAPTLAEARMLRDYLAEKKAQEQPLEHSQVEADESEDDEPDDYERVGE